MRQLKITKQFTVREEPSLDKYLVEIGKLDLLDAQEEITLAKRIQEGDEQALNTLVEANLRFVVSVAKQFQNQGLTLNDLINEGNIGLIKAALRFDASKGFKFISYAVWWIRQTIMQAIVNQARLVRLPVNKVSAYNKIKLLTREFEQKHERLPHQEELEQLLDLEPSVILEMGMLAKKHLSMDAPVENEDGNGNLYDFIRDENAVDLDDRLMKSSLIKDVHAVLKRLPERESGILACYFGLNGESRHNLEEIGERFDLTRERVRQIKEKALRKLRRTSRSKNLRAYLG